MLRRSPERSGGSTTLLRATDASGNWVGDVSVSADFVVSDSDEPALVVSGKSTAVLPLSPEQLIELGKNLIEEGIRLQQRPRA